MYYAPNQVPQQVKHLAVDDAEGKMMRLGWLHIVVVVSTWREKNINLLSKEQLTDENVEDLH